MAVVQGTTGISAAVGASTFQGLHTTQKPVSFNSGGHYRLSMISGTIAAALAASAVLFSARWAHPSIFAVVTKLRTRFMPLTPFTAATLTDHTSLDAFLAVAFSASHTGGTAVNTAATAALKVRQTMSASNFADLRIATTAALGGGTLTLAPFPFATSLQKGNRVNPAAATEEVIMPPFDGLSVDYNASAGEHPIVLGNGDGIVIRNRTVWPAAGTGILVVEMSWAETDVY